MKGNEYLWDTLIFHWTMIMGGRIIQCFCCKKSWPSKSNLSNPLEKSGFSEFDLLKDVCPNIDFFIGDVAVSYHPIPFFSGKILVHPKDETPGLGHHQGACLDRWTDGCFQKLGMIHIYDSIIWVFPKIAVPPNHQLRNRVFPYKPSILGYPYFWKHPYNYCI